MASVKFLILLPLVFSLQYAVRTEADETVRVKRDDDVTVAALQTIVQQQASQIQTLQADLTAFKNSQQADLTAYKHKVDSLETSVQSVKGKVDVISKSVAFTANILKNEDSINNGMALGHHQTVIFDNVITNIGNAYNNNNGVFTAPVAGTYVFFLTQMSPNHHGHLFLAIVNNGSILDIVFTEGSGDSYDQGSSQVTTHLATGDQVWVQQYAGDAVRGSWWTIFTGFLLHAD